MTMVPAQNDKQHRTANYYVFGCNTRASFGGTASVMNPVEVQGYNCLGSDFVASHMAEDESRTNTSVHNEAEVEAEVEAEAEAEAEVGSTSKEEGGSATSSWLQLSIGCQSQTVATATKHGRDLQTTSVAPIGSEGLVELDLLPSGRHSNWSASRPSLEAPAVFPAAEIRGSARSLVSCTGGSGFGASLLFEQASSSMAASGPTPIAFAHHQEMNWAFGPLPHAMPIMPSSSSSSSSSQSCSSLRPLGSFFPTPFHFPSSGAGFEFDVAGPSSDVAALRVVDPPRRPHSGIWFMLQASQNQAKEPFLPQIPKSYLRIKDGRMTVRLLLKYLVNKLRLESESEIEITCRGQQLLPFLTLQHVRDAIWTPRDTAARTLLSDSSTTDHVMVLHYGRSA